MGEIVEGLAGRSAMSAMQREGILGVIPPSGSVLEIGTLDGVTVACWAKRRPRVSFLSVDPFLRACGTGPGSQEHWQVNKQPNMELFVGTMVEYRRRLWARNLRPEYDVIVVDGDHSKDGCLGDLKQVEWFLKPDGIIIIDDYGRSGRHLSGVTEAVDLFASHRPQYEKHVLVQWACIIQRRR